MFKNQLNFITAYFQTLKAFDPFVSSSIKRQLVLVALLVLGVVVTNTFIIWLIGQPFNYLMQNDYSGLGTLLFFLGIVIAINQLLHYQNTFKADSLGLQFVADLRSLCLERFCGGKYSDISQYKKGDVLTRLGDDIDLIQRCAIESPLFFISHILTIIFYSVMLLVIDWKLALLAMCLTPIFFVHQYIFAKPKSKASRGFLTANGKLLAKEDEILGSFLQIKAFNALHSIIELHRSFFNKALFWALKERKLNALFNTSLAFLIYLCALFVVYFGVQDVESGALTIAELVSFLIYMGYISVPIRGIAHLGFQVQADIMAGDRIMALLKMPNEQNQSAKDFQRGAGKISIDSADYSINSNKIINDVTVSMTAGKSYALVGESGVGKSTIVKLISGFIPLDTGKIVIDDQLITEVNIGSLREAVATVWQHPLLFNDSIRNNMLLAKSDANDEDIIAALKAADAWEFVKQLNVGVDSVIGSDKIDLSGGQKQRLQIAQALLRDPSILVLDEATSALDSQAEERVMTNINMLRQGKTTVIVTHRYSAIKHVDEIIYINNDGSVTMGSHEDLLNTHKGYQHAINWQTKTEEN